MKPLLDTFWDNFPAKRLAGFFGLILVVGFQLAYLFSPQMGPNPYRAHERLALLRAWQTNSTEATKAAFDDELRLEDHHRALIGVMMPVSSFVVVDMGLLYVYWKCWIKKSAA